MKYYSIRIPVHGFVELSEWERDIINHPVFQRLRRIRQLAFSEHLYPGSVHTRFEHSLGVMHVATRLYDSLALKYQTLLRERLRYDPLASRARTLVRLAALLHDVGHAPFSHTGEDLMPLNARTGKRFTHEDYSASLIREEMNDVLDDHRINKLHHHIRGEEIAGFYEGKSTIGSELLFWKELVSGQLDADRMDYLLRDSYHCGVEYGKFDLARIVDTMMLVEDSRSESPDGLRIGIEPGGLHAAEGLILARYFMFTQVYFHSTRKAFDFHGAESLRLMVEKQKKLKSCLPDPSTSSGRRAYMLLDDWSVFEFIKSGKAGRHGEAILTHRHDRCVHQTAEIATPKEIERHSQLIGLLRKNKIDAWAGDADKEWYKVNRTEVRIGAEAATSLRAPQAIPLSEKSGVVARIKDNRQRLIFVPVEKAEEAKKIIEKEG